MTAQVFNLTFARLQEQTVVEEDGALVRLPGYEPTLSDEQNEQVNAYIRTLEAEPFSPPTDAPPGDEVLNLLDEQGKVVRVSETVVYSAEAYERMVGIISRSTSGITGRFRWRMCGMCWERAESTRWR